MWADAKRDGRPAEYRWRPLFNAAKFGWPNALRGWSKHVHHKSKMADGRHLGKIEKSPYLSNGLTDRLEIWRGDAMWPSPRWYSVKVIVTSTLVVSAKAGDILFYLYPSKRTHIQSISHIHWLVYASDASCSFSKNICCVESQDNLLTTDNKAANINVQKLQSIHTVNGDGSKTAKVIKR